MKVIGTCGKAEALIVKWYEGDRIAIEKANVAIYTDTRNIEEAIAICERNLINFRTK